MSNATKDSLYLIIAYFITSGLNYVFGVALSWFFTPAQFGVLGVTQSLLLLLALVVGSGFAWTAAHDIARGGINDENRLRFRTAWLTNLILGFVMGLGVWLAYDLNLLPLGPAYKNIIPLVSLTTVLLAVRAVTNGVLRGIYRFGSLSANLILEVVIKISASVMFVSLGMGVEGVMVGFALGAGISLLHSNITVRSIDLWKGKGWFRQNVISATIPLFIGMLGTALMLNLDILGLKLFAAGGQSDEFSGYYQVAAILSRIPVFLAQAITLVLFSYAAGTVLDLQDKQTRNYMYFQTALRSWFRFLVPIGLVLILMPGDVLYLLFPTQYQASSTILQITAVGGVLLSLVTLLNGIMQAVGYKQEAALNTGVATVCQIILLVVLVPIYDVYGAALSLLIAGTIAITGMMIFYVGNTDIQGMINIHREHVVKAVKEGLPILIMGILLVVIPTGTRFQILLKLSMTTVIYVLVLYGIQIKRRGRPQEQLNPLMSLIQLIIGV